MHGTIVHMSQPCAKPLSRLRSACLPLDGRPLCRGPRWPSSRPAPAGPPALALITMGRAAGARGSLWSEALAVTRLDSDGGHNRVGSTVTVQEGKCPWIAPARCPGGVAQKVFASLPAHGRLAVTSEVGQKPRSSVQNEAITRYAFLSINHHVPGGRGESCFYPLFPESSCLQAPQCLTRPAPWGRGFSVLPGQPLPRDKGGQNGEGGREQRTQRCCLLGSETSALWL